MRLRYDVKEDLSDLVLTRIYLGGGGDEMCVCVGGGRVVVMAVGILCHW